MGAKVLVVDDLPDNVELVSAFLTSRGFEVSDAQDGADAIAKAVADEPDMILLDIRLPVLDGFEVLEELKNRKIQTRVIMFSGVFVDIATAIRCIKAGACDFIAKPYTPTELLHLIQKHLVLERSLITEASKLDRLEEIVISGAEQLQRRNAEL